MTSLPKVGIGELRNKICPFCDSGKKFKKCKCFEAHNALIKSITPTVHDWKEEKDGKGVDRGEDTVKDSEGQEVASSD